MRDTDPTDSPADRREPVGAPVVRGNPEVTGERAAEATRFDPDDPESLETAASVAREFADTATEGEADRLYMLRGAAACATLVRGEGSYRAAAARAGGDVTVNFLRKWARVHDLPIAVRRHIATGDIVPSAAKHIARVDGDARFLLAWATIDHDLTVRDVRRLASEIADGASAERALADRGVPLGELSIRLSPDTYRTLRRRASLDGEDPADVVERALREAFDDS